MQSQPGRAHSADPPGPQPVDHQPAVPERLKRAERASERGQHQRFRDQQNPHLRNREPGGS